MAWFRRKDAESMDAQVLLARGHEATPLEPLERSDLSSPVVAGAASGFRMTVQDVFTITGRGTVVTGHVESGTISTGATVRLTRADGAARDIQVTAIEAFRKRLAAASAGQNVGLLLRELTKAEVAAGDVLSA